MSGERISSNNLDMQRQEHLAAIVDIERRFDAVEIANQREDTACFLNTVAFTHPDILSIYSSYPSMPNLLLWAVAVEAALLSEEETERCYFGQTDGFNLRHFTREDLVAIINGANALWFGTADVGASSKSQAGFNHIVGIVPYLSPYNPEPTFMVHDTSGHIDFEPQNIDDLYSSLVALPHSDRYMQSVFAFRDAQDQVDTEELANHDFRFFTPPSSRQ